MIISALEYARANSESEYTPEICNYGGSTYICDAISYIADSNTSIYYSDIISFISAHVEEVNDTIAEFGWDGCGSDLYKAGKMAEYSMIKRDLNDDFSALVQIYAANYLREKYNSDEISAETWGNICDDLDSDIDTDTRLEDIEAVVDKYMETNADETSAA